MFAFNSLSKIVYKHHYFNFTFKIKSLNCISTSTLREIRMATNKSSESNSGYNPAKSNYNAIEDACWKKGEKVPYLALARTFLLIEETSGRLKMIEILSNYLRSVLVLSPDDMLKSIYLCLNKLGPAYEGIELGVGESIIIKALAEGTGRKSDKIKQDIEKKGDIGLVAEASRSNQKTLFTPPKLTITGVFDKFRDIALLTGNATQAKKVEKIKSMIVACRESEARYLVRSLTGKLRIGLAEQSLLSALAQAVIIADKEVNRNSDSFKKKSNQAVLTLKTTYCECPNYGKIIPILIEEGIEALPKHCNITPGIPIKPMLAHPSKGVEEVLKRFAKNFTCEYKYDGERAQVHMTEGGEASIFSRNQENNTSKYPDIVSRIDHFIEKSVKSFILDCEAVAFDLEARQILPFQVLSTRKRKNVDEDDIKVQICLYAFDLLYFNGESMVRKPLRERRDALKKNFKQVEGKFVFATSSDVDSVEDVQEFLEESIRNKCEGLMVKTLDDDDATYEIAKRSHNWLKLKKDYLDGVGDTLDLVVIGAYHGKGKRAGVYGGFLLACYDNLNDEFQSICKLGTGFKDEDLETHSRVLQEHIISNPKSYYNYDENLKPDVWFDAVHVWEVKCADLSISPVHRAACGLVDETKGISLRFPRFVRVREDKKTEQATSSKQVAKMYESQELVKKSEDSAKNEDDDDYY